MKRFFLAQWLKRLNMVKRSTAALQCNQAISIEDKCCSNYLTIRTHLRAGVAIDEEDDFIEPFQNSVNLNIKDPLG